MSSETLGYVEFDGKVARFIQARCQFHRNQLDVEASSAKVKFKLYGIPLSAESVAQLPGKSFGPTESGVSDDPIAEGGIETKSLWLSWQSLHVRCGSYDAESGTLVVSFQAEVEDYESGRSGEVDGQVRATVCERLW